MAKLYIVATPIGNLEDFTYRAVATLKKVDLILCEDTRRTRKLLEHYKIKKPLLAYHQRSNLNRTNKVIQLLEEDKNLALVTDAGTPGISDPGNELIDKILVHFNSNGTLEKDSSSMIINIELIPIPGVSALTTLASVAGIKMNKFVFLGFPPNKKGRETFFKKVLMSEWPIIYYESPYRLLKNLELLQKLNNKVKLKLIIGRELTKMYEEIKRGTVAEILEYYQNNLNKVKGEIVIIVSGDKSN